MAGPVRNQNERGFPHVQIAGWLKFFLLAFASLLTTSFFLLPARWGANERHYLSQVLLANESNRGVFAAGFPNPTIELFITLASVPLGWFSIEDATLVLRLAGFTVLSLGLASLAYALKIGAPPLLLGISTFMLSGQTYFGGEWIFNGIEAKIFAYGFGLLALGGVFLGRLVASSILATIAVFFHPLVGLSFLAVGFLAVLLADRRTMNTFEKVVTALTLGIALAYPAWLRLRTLSPGDDDSSLARLIYAIVRNPHHVAPFGGTHPISGAEISGWFTPFNLIFPAAMALLLFLALQFSRKGRIHSLLKLSLILHSWIPLSLLLAWLDRDTQFLGVLYLFRPLSLLLLLSLIAIMAFMLDRVRFNFVNGFLLAIVVSWVLLGSPGPREIGPMPQFADLTDSGHRVVNMLSSETGERDTILVDFAQVTDLTGLTDQNFEIAAGRGQISVWKFVPTGNADILLWWQAQSERSQILNGKCVVSEPASWDYLLTNESNIAPDLISEVIAREGKIVLLPLNPETLEILCGNS